MVKLLDKLMEGNPIALIVVGLVAILLAIYWDWFVPLITLLITGASWERPLPIGLKILLAVIGVIPIGAGVGQFVSGKHRGNHPHARERKPAEELTLLQRIDFDYQDSPENHGWRIEGNPGFSLQPGGVLDITSRKLYSMHHTVTPLACSGTLIEFVARYEAHNTAVYARVAIQSQDGSENDEVWLKIQIGPHPPEQARGTHEWIWYVQPALLDGGWSRFEVNLPDAVKETFGAEGWSYRKLIGFRLRGRLKIKQILVYS
jgi:hypothetical protein